ncbi:hypothetical protein CROQUDRAFT_88442 [Cronartium quercuum f. sp. fusiforme G11]|uniref:Kinesin-like protein n=1 Tax=Cronartium quercuum f. sp. fusiforme G11 TaxID=708437 RepID=A0A9P6NN11_9BASI|nr:hypothetical protein CROQUDRAFT_88442 [Cronartium quercuum f. sp. fusiforme G11]
MNSNSNSRSRPSGLPKPSSIRPPTPNRFISYPLNHLNETDPTIIRKSSMPTIPKINPNNRNYSSSSEMFKSRRKNSIVQDSSNGKVSLIRTIIPSNKPNQTTPQHTPSNPINLKNSKSLTNLKIPNQIPQSTPNEIPNRFGSQPNTRRPTLLRNRPSLPSLAQPPIPLNHRPSDPTHDTRTNRIISTKTPVRPLRINKNPSSTITTSLTTPLSRSHSSASRDSNSTRTCSSPPTPITSSDYSSTSNHQWNTPFKCPLSQKTRPLMIPQKQIKNQNQRNNITVFVRIRRPINLPRPGQPDLIKTLGQNAIEVLSTPTGPRTVYNFDHVFGSEIDSQSEIYETLLSTNDLVKGFLEGFNATLIAYGQTSAGKSYTMGTGPASGSRAGVIPRAIEDIFNSLEKDPRIEQTVIKVAFLEVYNDELIDLLAYYNSSSGRKTPGGRTSPGPYNTANITIREEKGGGISWSGLREVTVNSTEEALEQLQTGLGRRATNVTEMNTSSSRSHAIFSVQLDQQILDDESNGTRIRRKSKFNFVDLAGSERVSKTKAEVGGERFKEGIAINSGLHALGNVISALSSASNSNHNNPSQCYIPYRESKLTRLLQDSLGGNSNTAMIACVSPEHSNLGETVSTLRYASRTRDIKNKSSLREERTSTTTLTDNERVELNRLRTELQALKRSQSPKERQVQFELAIRPVVEEYEKTLSSLELELIRTQNLLSAAQLELSLLRGENHKLYHIEEED